MEVGEGVVAGSGLCARAVTPRKAIRLLGFRLREERKEAPSVGKDSSQAVTLAAVGERWVAHERGGRQGPP